MAHKTIIISQNLDNHEHDAMNARFNPDAAEPVTYSVNIPLPHGCTPEHAGKMVCEALKNLDKVG